MTELEQRQFIRFLAKELKAHCRELMAYQVLSHAMKKAGYVEVDEILGKARNSPEVQERLDKNFVELDKLLPPSDQDHLDSALHAFLEKWKPLGEPN